MGKRLRVSLPARADIIEILNFSERQFGMTTRLRYRRLLDQAFSDLRENCYRHGVKLLADEDSIYAYHLNLSRQRVSGAKVKRASHLIVFSISENYIDIVRVLHERMFLPQHLTQYFQK